MSLFSFKQSYLGIDIGASGIKLVELGVEKGKARLVTYGYVDFAREGSLMNNDFFSIAKTALGKLIDETHATSRTAISAIPNHSVFSSILRLPVMNKKELSSAIYWEAKKFVPLPLDDMVLDWKMLEEGGKKMNDTFPSPPAAPGTPESSREGEEKKDIEGNKKKKEEDGGTVMSRVLITAAPKNIVQKYSSFFSETGIELIGLETESFALERSLVGLDRTPTMIVDIGATATSIIIAENGIPVLNRNIDVGGQTITQSLVNRLRIDYQRAEQFKRDIGFSDDMQNSIPKAIETTVNPIVNEIKYALDIYLSHPQSKPVERIILTGGSAYLPKLSEYLSETVHLRVFVGNPWSRVLFPDELKPALDEIGPRFSGAVGLAMREMTV